MSVENRVQLIGYTGKDAETAHNPNGKQVTRISVATNKRYMDQHEKWQDKTTWHKCVAYGRVAETAAKIQRGAHVVLEGELVYREYDRTIETAEGPVKVQWPLSEIWIASIKVLDRQAKSDERRATA